MNKLNNNSNNNRVSRMCLCTTNNKYIEKASLAILATIIIRNSREKLEALRFQI